MEIIKKYIKNDFVKNYIWKSIQLFSKNLFLFFLYFVAAFLISKEDYGILNYWMSILTIFLLFSNFGIAYVVLKQVSEYKKKEKSKIFKILSTMILFFLLTGFLTIIGLFVFKFLINPQIYIYLKYYIPLFFIIPIIETYNAFLVGMFEFKKISLITLFNSIATSIIAFFLINYFGLIGVLYSYILFYILQFIFLTIVVLKFITFSFDYKILKENLVYGFYYGLEAFSILLFVKLDIYILGYFSHFEYIGIYELINKITELAVIPFGIGGLMIFFIVNKYHISKEKEKTKYLLKQIIKITLLIIIVCIFIQYLIVPILIQIFFPKYYTLQTINLFYILLFLMFPVKALKRVIDMGFLFSTGKIWINIIGNLIFGLINLGFNVYFIINFNFYGIVFTTVITYIGALCFNYFIYFKKYLN